MLQNELNFLSFFSRVKRTQGSAWKTQKRVALTSDSPGLPLASVRPKNAQKEGKLMLVLQTRGVAPSSLKI